MNKQETHEKVNLNQLYFNVTLPWKINSNLQPLWDISVFIDCLEDWGYGVWLSKVLRLFNIST